MSIKVVVAGPPHSGKSVFVTGLTANLPRESYYLFRACPDGEGTWTYKSEDSATFRRKGEFTKDVVDWYCKCLSTCNLASITLVDIGGRMSPENVRILKEGSVTHAIILSSCPKAQVEWREWLEGNGLTIIESIISDYNAEKDNEHGVIPMVHHLERGEDVSSRPTIVRVATKVIDLVSHKEEASQPGKEVPMNTVLNIPEIAEMIGKVPETKTLPNGRVVTAIDWQGTDLLHISQSLHNTSGEMTPVVDVNGSGPGWLYVALAHEAHPRDVRFNSPDGWIAVGCNRPEGEGKGDNLEFKVEHQENGWVMVTAQQKDPSIPLTAEGIWASSPPEVEMGAKVILSGRLPHWALAAFALAYHAKVKAIACFQPGVGATVAITHSAEVELGSIIK